MTRTAGFAVFLLSMLAALALQLVILPDALAMARPMWLALVVGYWALLAPAMPVLVAGWIAGLACDVIFNAVLGEHALALTALAFAMRKLRPTLVMFPLWQATLALVPAWAAYAFLLFWIDGLTRHPGDPMLRWVPVISTTLAWPLLCTLLNNLTPRRRSGAGLP